MSVRVEIEWGRMAVARIPGRQSSEMHGDGPRPQFWLWLVMSTVVYFLNTQ